MSDETEVDLSDRYRFARAQIEHENILVGQRTTWYLTFQGFLFTALFVAIGLFDEGKRFSASDRLHLIYGVLLIGVLGITSSIACFRLISAAYDQMDAVKKWWHEQKPRNHYPPVTGEGGANLFGTVVNGAHFLIFVAIIWVIFMCIFISAILHSYCRA